MSCSSSWPNGDYRGLEGLRSDEAVYQVFQSCIARCDELSIEEPNLPPTSAQLSHEHGATGSHQWVSAEEFFRVQYFKFLDSTMASLKRHYDQPGIQTYIKLESILLKPVTAVVDVEAVVEHGDHCLVYLASKLYTVNELSAFRYLTLGTVFQWTFDWPAA